MTEDWIDEVKEFFGKSGVVVVGSGLAGLYLILRAHGVRGKKVLIPAMTGWTVPIAVAAAGGTPILIDLDVGDANMDLRIVERALETDADVAAIIAVDGFGYPAAIEKMMEMVSGRDCLVVEDSCHAYGGRTTDGVPLGARGHVGVMSFGHAKPIVCRGGGVVVTNDEALAGRVAEATRRKEFNFLKDFKNQFKVKCIIKRRYGLLRWAAEHARLLHYNMNDVTRNAISAKWKTFVSEVDAARMNLYRCHEMLGKVEEIRRFDYCLDGWLPWRYSFTIENPEAAERFERVASDVGLLYSRLYPTLKNYYPDLESFGSIEVAEKISQSIYNLNHLSTIESTEALLKNLGAFIARWNTKEI